MDSELMRRRVMMFDNDEDAGLFAYWDGADSLVSNQWIDRLNNIPIRIGNNTTHGDGYYSITKTSNSAALGYMQLRTDISSYIDYELVVRVVADVQTYSGYGVIPVVDFGAYGTARWNYAFTAGIDSAKKLYLGAKTSSNQSLTIDNQGTYSDWNDNGWNYDVVLDTGIYVTSNDKQRVFSRISGIETFSQEVTKAQLTPYYNSGVNAYCLFGHAIAGANYMNSYRFTINVKSIKMYNIKK